MSRYIPLYFEKDIADLSAVDDSDYPQLMVWRWNLIINPQGVRYGHRFTTKRGANQHIFIHQVVKAMELEESPIDFPYRLIDHRDHDGLNNRRVNLRLASVSQNNCNQRKRKDNSTGYKGVAIFHDRFRSRITFEGRVYYLGVYFTAKEAALAYDVAAIRLHGEFAVLNFPEERPI